MRTKNSSGAIALTAAILMTIVGAQAQDASKYPDWSGQWRRAEGGPNRYDPSKPPGRAQEIPLTAEYQAIYEAGLKDQADGGQGNNLTYRCIPGGLPRAMTAQQGIEFIVTPKTTYVWFNNGGGRRIYTDGRAWPENEEPAFNGYSIGKWLDTGGDGRYETLEVETRNFKGPARSTAMVTHCTRTTRPSFTSGSTWTRPSRISCATISRRSIMPWPGHTR